MNQTYNSRKKYSSFLASIILHILILLLLFYALRVKINQETIFRDISKDPAKVSFLNKKRTQTVPAQIPVTVPITLPPTGLTSPPIAPATQMQAPIQLPIDQKEEILEKENIYTDNQVNKEEIAQEEPNNNILNNLASAQNQEIFRPTQNYNQEANTNTTSGNIVTTKHRGINNKKKRRITGAQLLRAFSNVYRQEQDQQMGIYGKRNSKENGSIFSSVDQERSNVQERADEWKIHLYQSKVLRAIAQAANLYSKEFYSSEDIEKIISPKLVIDSEGKISALSADQLSGNPKVDSEILKFLNSADIPGIPKNFGVPTFIFTLNIKITLKRGINKVYITAG